MDKLKLRSFCDDDLPRFQKWLHREHVARWYEHPSDWMDEVTNRHAAFSWIHHFIGTCDGADAGFCQYYEYRKSGESWHGTVPTDGTYSIDYLIGEQACLGKGIGTGLVRELLSDLAKLPGARRVIVQPDPQNTASRKTLLSAGFVYDGANELYLYSFPTDDNR